MNETELPQDEDRVLLRDSIRGLLEKAWPASQAVERSSRPEDIRQTWSVLAGQGLATLGTDANEDGLRELAIVLEEFGISIGTNEIQRNVVAQRGMGLPR